MRAAMTAALSVGLKKGELIDLYGRRYPDSDAVYIMHEGLVPDDLLRSSIGPQVDASMKV